MTLLRSRIVLVLFLSLAFTALVFSGQALADEPDVEVEDVGEADELPTRGQVVPPSLRREVRADYTNEAVEARVEGDVILEITIDADGMVQQVVVAEGLGYGLDEAAMDAAWQFEFEPATLDGTPVPVTLNFAVRFSLPIFPANFAGRLADPETDEGIEGARIEITYVGDEHSPPPQARTFTDADGNFLIEEMPHGTYAVTLSVEEYADFETDIELVQGETTEVEYSLTREVENLVGQIREAGTRSPLAGTEITLLDQETGEEIRQDFSVREGRFGFRGVPPGQYVLRVTGDGFITASFEVEVAAQEITEGTFYVRAETYDSLTVRTTAERERAEVTRQTIRLEEVRRIPGAANDVIRAVQNLPGVARPQFLGGQIIVRGSAPEDTAIFLEGDSIPIAFHFLGGPAVISTEMVDAINFYPGNFSTRYGRATAGVIDIGTRSPRTDRFHGTLQVDLLNSAAIVEGPINDNWSFALSGRRSYYDLFLPSILRRLETDIIVTPRYYDYQSWTTYRSDSGNHKVEFFIYGSDDSLDLILPEGEPQGDQNIQVNQVGFDNFFHRGQARWEWTPEDMPLESSLMGSFGLNRVALEATEDLFFILDYYTSQIRWDNRVQLSENLRLRAGVDAQLGDIRYSFAFPDFDATTDDTSSADGQSDAPNIEGNLGDERQVYEVLPAVYAEVDYELFDRWTLTPGLRADYFGPVNEVSISPRFSTRYRLTDEVLLKGGVGLFTQPPIPGQTEEDFGNPDLTFEKAMHYALGTEWRPLDFVTVDTTLFFRDSFDLVSTTNAEVLDDEGRRRPLIYDNTGQGRAYGWELLVRHNPRNNFFGWIAYTLSRSERLSRSTGDWVLFGFDQTHILTLVAGYNLPWNFDVSGRFRLVTGNPETPIVGAAFDADADTYRPQFGDPNSTRAGTFNQLDIRVDRRWIFNTWTLSAYLDITNVYNAVNPEGTRYNFDYTDSEPLRGLPFLPTLGVTARF